MRPLEGLILIAILFSLLAYLVPKSRRPRWLSLLPALAALFVVIHLVVEGYRWQMVPAYVLAAIVVVGMIRCVPQKAETQSEAPSRKRRISALIGIALGLLVLALAAALPSISPVFSLPEPTGPHAVGTQYYYWTDEDRPDEYTTDPGDFVPIVLLTSSCLCHFDCCILLLNCRWRITFLCLVQLLSSIFILSSTCCCSYSYSCGELYRVAFE